MATSPVHAQVQAGISALQAGDPARARTAFEAAVADGSDNPQLWLYLAHTLILLGEDAQADPALDRVLAIEPVNLYALCIKGDVALRRGDERGAASYWQFALGNVPESGLSPDLVERLQAAQAELAQLQSRFRTRITEAFGDLGGERPARFREALSILMGEAPPYPQQPTSFYYPRLAPIPFFETADIAWIAELERAGPAIRDELIALLAKQTRLEPYVKPDAGRPHAGHALLNDPSWSALYLWRNGTREAANADLCPIAMETLAKAPMPRIASRSPMALFSVLTPHTHIPPHNGLLNTRLICHLPLVVPPNCQLRVGAETRAVEPFKAMLFDDSIEHEAWNDSDETRVVLLFEVWRPELDASERDLLVRMFETVVSYGG